MFFRQGVEATIFNGKFSPTNNLSQSASHSALTKMFKNKLRHNIIMVG